MANPQSKVKSENIHAKKRFEERYGLKYTRKLRASFIRQIQEDKAGFIRRDSLTRTVWMVEADDGQCIKVVYNSNTKNIVTALPVGAQ